MYFFQFVLLAVEELFNIEINKAMGLHILIH